MKLIVDNIKEINITKLDLETIITTLVYCSWHKEEASMPEEVHDEILGLIKKLTFCL